MAYVSVPPNLLYRMLDVTQDLVSVVDYDGCFVYVNPAWSRALGWSRDHLVGHAFMDFVHPDDQGATAKETADLQDPRHTSQRFTNRYQTRDGSWRWLSWTGVSDPKERLYFAVCQDITSQVEMQERVEELESSMVDFADMASHDLKNPLSTAAIQVELIKRRSQDDAIRTHAAKVERSLKAMRAITESLHRFARLNHEATNGEVTSLQDVASSFADQLDDRVEIDIEDLPTCNIDAGYARHLIQNLVGNAVKYGGDPPRVVLRGAGAGEGLARFTVTDNGIGIPDDEWEAIFQPGYRLHGKEYEGTGLGLALCQRLVSKYRGRIRVRSSTPGKGTTFEIVLPQARPG